MQAQTYLKEAQGLTVAVEILCKKRGESTLYSIGILASHSLELALKSYLLHSGMSEKELMNIGHNINEAWNQCVQSGLPLGELPLTCPH